MSLKETFVTESQTSPAVAGQLSFVGFRAGVGRRLRIKQLIIPSDANVRTLAVRVARTRDFDPLVNAALTVGLMAPEEGPDAGRSSQVQVGSSAGLVGNGLFGLSVEANGKACVYEFPGEGFTIYGNDPSSFVLLVSNGTVNQDLHVGVVAYESPTDKP